MKLLFSIITTLLVLHVAAQQKDSLPQKDTTSFNKTQRLNEVVVNNKKQLVQMQADKIILNVQNDVVASGGTVFEVLQKAPGVSISNDEVINLAGKAGVNILIDGRPTQMSAKDLASYLKATPASLVDKIEIIMNPSAKYDAQGNAGIINIRMKKNITRGTNGNISTSYTQSNHPNYNFSGNLNRRQGKWNAYGNIAARKSRQNTQGAINRYVNSNGVDKTFANKTTDQDASKNISFETGVDYYLDKKNTFGVIIKGNEYWSKLYTPGITLINSNNTTDSSLQTVNDNQQRNSRYNFNANYKYEDTLGNELNIDADYTSFKNNSSGLVTADLLNKQNTRYGYTANDQSVLTQIKIRGIKMDYNHQFKKAHAKIESGIKYNTIQTDNDLEALAWNNNQFKPDTGRTNTFHYTEKMLAAYASFNQTIKKWEYQVGIRTERPVIKGNSIDLRNTTLRYPDTSYINIFPTAFIRYTINNKHALGISYGRRINRPTFQDLNPFEYIYDNYSKERGNPYLLPEFSHNAELNYSYKGAINMALGYSYTNNSFQSISTLKGEVTEVTMYNIGSEKRCYLSLNASAPITKWWQGYVNLNPFYKTYRGAIPEGKLDNSTWGMSWYSSHTFTFTKKWKAQISTWGNVRTLDGIYRTSGLGSLDAGTSKLFLKDRLNIRVSVTDIFNTQRWKQQANFGNVHFNFYRKWESRNFRLQLTWKLGKTNFKLRDRELGAQEEINRIK